MPSARRRSPAPQFWQFQPDYRPRGAGQAPGPDQPVHGVALTAAIAYCEWLSQKESLNPRERYRLPTEAEWLYASAAGAATSRHYGDSDGLLPKYAQFLNNSQGRVREVGLLKPNDFGLFDTLGNVNEWCADTFLRQGGSLLRVARGGSATGAAASVNSSARLLTVAKASPLLLLGFRIARSL